MLAVSGKRETTSFNTGRQKKNKKTYKGKRPAKVGAGAPDFTAPSYGKVRHQRE